jgi:serine protease
MLGSCGGYSSDMADAINWAAGGAVFGVPSNTTPARVINMSLGGAAACPAVVQNAINKARALGAVVVAAAGNDGGDATASMPGNCAGVVTVTATNRQGDRPIYANFGTNVTLAAPGGDWNEGIWSTLNSGSSVPGTHTYGAYYGTSMAAPHVSATVALMLTANKNLMPDQVQKILQDSSSGYFGACDGCGAGALNTLDAVLMALDAAWTGEALNEVEPNNTMGAAQTVATTPTLVNGSIASNTDGDYFKVSVVAKSKVVATLTADAASNFDLYAYDAYGRQVSASVNDAGLNDVVTVSNTASTTTTVYLRVVRNAGSVGNYTLNVANR